MDNAQTAAEPAPLPPESMKINTYRDAKGVEHLRLITVGATKHVDGKTGEVSWYVNSKPYDQTTYWDGLREAAVRFADWSEEGKPVVGPERVPLEDILADINAHELEASTDESRTEVKTHSS